MHEYYYLLGFYVFSLHALINALFYFIELMNFNISITNSNKITSFLNFTYSRCMKLRMHINYFQNISHEICAVYIKLYAIFKLHS